MPQEAIQSLQVAAKKKADSLANRPIGYIVSAMLAGAYVGAGVFLAFAVGAPMAAAGSPWTKVVMGGSFPIALSLVVFAGGDLFTGNAMTMPLGVWGRSVAWRQAIGVWCISWVGNLMGALVLAAILHQSGVFGNGPELDLVQSAAAKKMHLAPMTLVARGIICNWMVCLGVWCANRMKSESGKLLMIFWCLYAFVAAGFEHSVANMTLFGLALMQPHAAAVSLAGMGYNLLWVTVGNLIGGAVFVGGAYQAIAKR